MLGFNGRHDRAEAWVREQAGKLIEGIIEDQRQAIRAVIEEGVTSGKNPRAIALDIIGRVNKVTGRREGGLIGLSSAQTDAVIKAARELASGDPKAMLRYLNRTRRDARFDRLVRKAIEGGKKLSAADQARIIGRYKDRLLQLRGENIARTEALNAYRAGRHEGFAQLADSGTIRREQIKVTWSATGDLRTRDTHIALNKQEVTFGNFFVSPSGALLEYPGDVTHGAPGSEVINCRCYADYKIKRDPYT